MIDDKLVGIISAATTIGGYTAIYTELSAYRNWINNVIETV